MTHYDMFDGFWAGLCLGVPLGAAILAAARFVDQRLSRRASAEGKK